MEAPGRTALYVCSVLLILTAHTFSTRTEVSSDFIYMPSLVHRGIEGRPLFLSVETRFPMDNAEIQGTWFHTNLSGSRTLLVTFTKASNILNMTYRNRLLFKEPNASLLIHKLNQGDEGDYHLSLNIEFDNKPGEVFKGERTVHVTVDVPVSSPVIEKNPNYAVIEDKANVTWTCSVETGTRVVFQWLRDNIPLGPRDRYHFSQDNSTLLISPVRKEDKGVYRCVASNPISHGRHSRGLELDVYYGPYNLEVNSGQGLRIGEMFTINPGELAFFECQADSNPPNSYVWISKSHNSTKVITEGPRLEVLSYRLAQAEEYLCRAFNNVTQKQDEAQFTLLVASLGKDKQTQEGSSVSPLAAIAVCSLFTIGCFLILLFFLRRNCNPKRVLVSIYNRPLCEQKKPHRSGHEDATEDFGIYEFVSIPGKIDSTQVSCRSLARLESVQDMHTTIYDVIRHVPTDCWDVTTPTDC
ncbi:HEPACAM family member 2 isoform X1 [Pleuronectes platessa]|uniref:HEPACAM family member 2 isoform X1 n=1 Tax=Pleuronectes platessa TaxID=8262 RepID=UPI00232A1178|nr:HEPACAM family member 2 isoform X1 [Pleuronectes platessa]XP_053302495.1 HEPACAM family member 2 isoform X1 [Pleuronectes platessa]XP_053302496.1 HEPACAM family member 2 isoform X1 [Pleuronectes platessa]